jgi:2-haloacid dehalogenase
MDMQQIVFDIGNVLIRWNALNLYRKMGYADDAAAAIMAETGLLEVNQLLDAGGPFGETITGHALKFPDHAEFILAFDARWPEMLNGAIDENVAILKSLRRSGTPVHAISNFSREKFDVARELFPFLDEFDELIVSGDVGCTKPGLEIFQLLIDRRGIDPAKTVFVDDSPANITAASSIGFDAILFAEGETDLSAELLRRNFRI